MNDQPTQPTTAPGVLPRHARSVVLGIILVGGCVPLLLYYLTFGQAPAMLPSAVKPVLRGGKGLLIDIRPAEEFGREHIDGALNWPSAEILAVQSAADVPDQFKSHTLFLLCTAGYRGAIGARHLGPLVDQPVFNIRGGIQEWIASAPGPQGEVFDRFKAETGEITQFPSRQAPGYEQLAAIASGFVIKPAYTLIALALVIILWRNQAPDLAVVRRAMAAFFIGENCCLMNALFFKDTSHLLEYLHSLGMLLCFGLVVFAILEGLDQRVFLFSDPSRKCAAAGLCGRCIKYADVPCGLKRLFLVIIPACLILALMPGCADRHLESYNTLIVRLYYNYSHRLVYQLFETVYCPAAAALLLAASLIILTVKKTDAMPWAKITFAAGIGPMAFGLMRMILTGTYARNLVWFALWEEITELLFILAVCAVLWFFRHGLFRRSPA